MCPQELTIEADFLPPVCGQGKQYGACRNLTWLCCLPERMSGSLSMSLQQASPALLAS